MTKSQVYLAALLEDIPPEIIPKFLTKYKVEANELLEQARQLALGIAEPEKKTDQLLASVYGEIFKTDDPIRWYYKAEEMNIGQDGYAFFPGEDNKYDIEAVKQLWKDFSAEATQLETKANEEILAECLLALLQKYTVNIHCGFAKSESISFYDYTKSKAAIALCLHDWILEPVNKEDEKKQQEKNGDGESLEKRTLENAKNGSPFLLIAGDLSGIQTYIYEIISKNAAKSLKGRSFYLQLLVDSVINSLLFKLELFQCQIIVDSGGGFNLLAPNTQLIKNSLADFKEFIDRKLFEEHQTLLFLGITYLVVSSEDLQSGRLSNIYKDLNKKITKQKYQRNLPQVLEYESLFHDKGIEVGGNTARDIITGEEIDDEELKNTYYNYQKNDRDEDDERYGIWPAEQREQDNGEDLIKEYNAKQIILGRELKRLDYWVVSKQTIKKIPRRLARRVIDPAKIGICNYLISEDEFRDYKSLWISGGEQIYVINSTHIDPELFDTSDIKFRLYLYGGNAYPETELKDKETEETKDHPRTFSEMAGAKDADREEEYIYTDFEETDFKRLGVLRMDVDDLGFIFRKGFWKDNYTPGSLSFSKHATLSRNMDYFFKGYLNTIWENGAHKSVGKEWIKKKIADNSQIIYSGGDDLFVVGRWHLMVELAEEIRNHFQTWTCDHPDISISGGISIVTPKYPIMKAVDMAGDAEKDAKKHNQYQKRAFSFLGTPIHYKHAKEDNRDYEIVKKLKNELLEFVAEDSLPRGILQKIMMLEGMRRDIDAHNEEVRRLGREHEVLNPKWNWTTAYYFSKEAEVMRRQGKMYFYKYLKGVSENILFNKYEGKGLADKSTYIFLQLYALAARWAELERRQLHSRTHNNDE